MKTTSPIPISLRSLFASALISCGGTLAVCWPATLHAVDEETEAEAANEQGVPDGATEVDGMYATTEFVPDEKKGSVRVRLVAANPSQDSRVAKLAIAVQEYEINPMARSAPPPEVRFEDTAHIIVPPGDRFEKELLLPPDLAHAILDSIKASDTDLTPDENGNVPTHKSYEVTVSPYQDSAAG